MVNLRIEAHVNQVGLRAGIGKWDTLLSPYTLGIQHCAIEKAWAPERPAFSRIRE